MRKSLNASVLLLVLCCPVFAGDMLTPPITSPIVKTSATTGSGDERPGDEVPDPPPADDQTAQDISLTGIAVSILESLLAIL